MDRQKSGDLHSFPIIRCTVNMPDNLNIKGIEDDLSKGGRRRKNRGRKGFVLQARYRPGTHRRPSPCLDWLFRSLEHWYTHSRYQTESARDHAYAALVKKAANERDSRLKKFSQQEFRKL